MMLLDSKEILIIESRLISLFDRTFKRGITGYPARLKGSIKKQFKSATFRIQLDSIIDDLFLTTIKYTDASLNGRISASTDYYNNVFGLVASAGTLPLTEEAVRQSVELSDNVAESIIRTLTDEGIYQEHPRVLAKRMKDLWGGEKYRAERFARAFSADVASSTTLYRYKQQGIEYMQIYALIDGRTSSQCRLLHGTIFKVDSPEAQKYHPPFHHHCRTTILPVPVTMEIDPAMRYENRDFSRGMDQNFKPLKESFDPDLVKGTFKNIDVFNEKYRISKFILDEDIEKRLAKLGVGIEADVPKAIKKVKKAVVPKADPIPVTETGLKYVPAKNAKEAEQWLLKNTQVKYTDMKGVNIDIINDMNECLAFHLNLDPKLKDQTQFYGTCQGLYEQWYQLKVQKQYESLKRFYPGDEVKALERAKRSVKKPKVPGNVHAFSATSNDLNGIWINKAVAKNKSEMIKSLENSVSIEWHPIGCNSPKSVIDHEFGHAIDNIYNISGTDIVNDYYERMTRAEITNNLSTYAATNKKEFVAEAWSEYLNNPEPRPIAKSIGQLIEKSINEGKI